jgi:phosphatidylinositol-3-phosphatase
MKQILKFFNSEKLERKKPTMKKISIYIVISLFLASCSPASYLTSTDKTGPGLSATNTQVSTSNTQPSTPSPTEGMPTAVIPTATPQPLASAEQMETPSPEPTATNVPIATATTQPVSTANSSGLPNFDHIILIMLENRDYKSVIGSKSMPLLNTLANQNVLLANYFAVTHPSLPNYIALVSGGTQNIKSDCNSCFVNQPNLADRIEASGRTWKSYMESMPSPCFLGDSSQYAQKHNPFIYFDSIRLNPTRCDSSIVPLTALDADLSNNQLPNFSFIMPNLCNSGHDCSADVTDKWVNAMVTKLQSSPALGINSLIIIAFDEGSSKSTVSCCGLTGAAGGQVAVVLISPSALPDVTDTTPYSHYSLLKTILTAWNLPALGQTALDSTVPIEVPWTGQK